MKGNFFRNVAVGFLTAIIAFTFSGCELLGGGKDNNAEPAVYISQNEISLWVGDTVQLYAVSTDGSAIVWDSSNIAVAAVENGLVTAVSKGEAVVMASTDSVMSVCTIKVGEAPAAVQPSIETLVLSLPELSLEVGSTVTLNAKSSAAGAQISWDSSNKAVATVTDGTVTALTAGKTTITAKTGTAVAVCQITVKEKVIEQPQIKPVYISQSEILLSVGKTVQLSVVAADGRSVVWTSSNNAVATVENGLVTGVSKGEAVITVSAGSEKAVCTVKVQEESSVPLPDVETLVLSLTELSLEKGEEVTLTAKSSISGAQIIWESSNKSVATVSNGKVTALKAGTTAITANTGTAVASCNVTVTEKASVSIEKPGYSLVWHDEFEGNSLDTSKWGYQTGTRDIYHGFDTQVWNWGNEELQYYTQDSVKVENGSLVITASRQTVEDKEYKSGRIITRDLAYWTYGYIEARIKTPTGNGMWPAFWMLPQPSSYSNVENRYGGWPYNGEIDIMEAKGRLQNVADTTLHFGPIAEGTWQSEYKTSSKTLSSDTDQWHTYAVNWTSSYIAWIIDDKEAFRVSSNFWYSLSPLAYSEAAPFDQPFYILLNLAVGGNYDGGIAPDPWFSSASMYVDYVRVFQKA